MASISKQLVAAIAAVLNAAPTTGAGALDFERPIIADQSAPETDLAQIATVKPRVYIINSVRPSTLETRSTRKFEPVVEIGLQRRHTVKTDDGDSTRELTELVEAYLWLHARTVQLTNGSVYSLLESNLDPVFVPQHSREARVMTCVIQTAYRGLS